jgi:phosphoribosylglycinamide formyltransferase-1
MSIKKSVILFSGNGSNLKNLLENSSNIKDKLVYEAAFTNNPQAGGIEVCNEFSLDIHVCDDVNINSELSKFLKKYDPDLIILAGYMKIIPSEIVNQYVGKIMNIHPSLLPKYPGLDTYSKILANNDTHAGATVHFVTCDLDQGPIILQGKYVVPDASDESSLQILTHNAEHAIYPIAVKWFANDIIKMEGEKLILDEKLIESPIVLLMDKSGV